MPESRTKARVGELTFHTRYDDPIVDVDTEANTVEKETIDDSIIVQHLGRLADRIHIEGIITESQTGTFDDLVASGEVTVRTHRWSGTAIVEAASSDYTQSYDPVTENEEWLYEITLDLVEVDEIPSQAYSGGGGSGGGLVV